MALNLYLTNTNADSEVTGGSGTKHEAGWVAGAAATLRNKNGVAGPTSPVQVTDSTVAGTDGTAISWYSPPLKAVTIAGAITASLWNRENATNNNAAPTVRVERCSGDGTVQSTIVAETTNHGAAEMGTTAGGASDSVAVTAGNVTDTALSDGDRLRLTLWIDDAADQGGTGSLSSGAQTQHWVNGPNGAQGQSQFAFAEALLQYTTAPTSPFPTLVQSYFVSSAAQDLGTLTTPSFTPADGELIVVKAVTADDGLTFNTPSGGSLTYTSRVSASPGTSFTRNQIWSAAVGVSPGSMTVSMTVGGVANWHSMVVERWSNAQLDATPATASASGTDTVATTTITTEANNSVATWCMGDWDASDGRTARVYGNWDNVYEQQHRFDSGAYDAYYATTQVASAGSATLSVPVPTAPTWVLIGLEIQASSVPASDAPRRRDRHTGALVQL